MFSRTYRRTWFAPIAFLTLFVTTPAYGQTMSVSSYADSWADFSLAYGEISFFDDSTGCEHSDYYTSAGLTGPSGFATYYNATNGASLSLTAEEGSYSMSGMLSFTCSCVGYYPGAGSADLDFDVGFRTTYWKDAIRINNKCYWTETACTSGTPTCTSGYIQDIEWTSNCTNYHWGTYLVFRKNSGPWVCTFGAGGHTTESTRVCT